MADPVSALALIGGGSAIAGGGLSAIGQLQAADAQGKAAAVEADAMQEQGRLTQFSAYEDAKQLRFQGNKLLAEQTNLTAASGLVANTGSALDVARESARQIELDAIKTEFSGMQGKYVADRQADLTRYGAKLARREATLGAIGSILTGVASGANSLISGFGSQSGPKIAKK